MSLENSKRLYEHYISLGKINEAENIRKGREFVKEIPKVEEVEEEVKPKKKR